MAEEVRRVRGGLQRGKEGSQAKHLSTAEFKAKKIIERAERREREIDEQTEKKKAELDDLTQTVETVADVQNHRAQCPQRRVTLCNVKYIPVLSLFGMKRS